MRYVVLVTFLLVGLSGCSDEESYPEFEVYSIAFGDGNMIPKRHTCFGDNISPPLAFDDYPEETDSFAIIMDEPEALGGPFTHWLIWGMRADEPVLTAEFAEDFVAENYPEQFEHIHIGPNSGGLTSYTGPCTDDGEIHTYRIRVFALKEGFILYPEEVDSASDLKSAMNGKIVGMGELTGIYIDN